LIVMVAWLHSLTFSIRLCSCIQYFVCLLCQDCAEELELRVVRYQYMVEKYLSIFGDVSNLLHALADKSFFGQPFAKWFALCYRIVVYPVLSVTLVYCGQTVGLIKMKLGAGRLQPQTQLPSPRPKKGHSLPIFGPCPLWRNGWMDYDATWCGGRSRPRRLCVRWGSSSPQKRRHSPQFIGHRLPMT